MFKSRVNQPTRVFINSSDDPSDLGNVGFNSFRINLQTPILNAKKLQLLRTTIPNAQINIPDYMLTFWYYSLPTATTAPAAASLRCVRLYPSNYVAPAALGTAFTKNRFFSDPADFVTQLNLAAAAGGDNVTYNPNWVAGDVSFSYNATTKQISMTGLTAGRFYAIAGWNDPIVIGTLTPNAGSAWAANTSYTQGSIVTNGGNRFIAQTNSAGTAVFNTDGAFLQIGGLVTMPNFTGAGTSPQPSLPQYTLNLRVGYAMSGNAAAGQITVGNVRYANLTNTAFANAVAIPPDSYPNLVYTGSIYLYSDMVAGSSVCSNTAHNLLAVIPVNAPQLGVVQYVAATLTWLDKIPDNIYEINILIQDENNQPFNLPDSAVVNVELGIAYE